MRVCHRAVALALFALVGVAVVQAAGRVDGQVAAYPTDECSGAAVGTLTYENGTRCEDLYQSAYFGDFLCSETGSPSGSVCTERTCGEDCPQSIPPNSREFGQAYCFLGATPVSL